MSVLTPVLLGARLPDCEAIQVDMVGVVDVSKAHKNIIAIWQHIICLPVCTCVWTMGIWSKVNIPRDCASIQVEMVGVVDMTKALECNWSSRIKNAWEQYKDIWVLCNFTVTLQIQK